MRLDKIFSIAVAAAALLSCAKEISPNQGGVNNTDKEYMTIEAQVEQQVETKTSLSGNVVSWTEGDKLSVFAGEENVLFELKGINNGIGRFEGEAPAAETYYALYPYSTTATISADGVISTVLPCNQNGVAGSFDNELNISVAKSASKAMTMRNICGLVKFNITRSDISSVTLFGNGHENLAGAIDITIDEDGTPSYTVKNGVKHVMITPKAGETFAPGTYYFTVLPQTLKGGMSFVYTVADQSGTVATGSDAVVNRSEYLNVIANPESALALNNIIDLSNPDGDATAETANCYVAGLAGRRYCFPATVMGNGVTTPAATDYTTGSNIYSTELKAYELSPLSAKLLWQTNPCLIKHVVLANGKIFFTMNGRVGGSLTEGNALIAGLDSNNLPVWSWHIWVTNDDLDANVQTWKVHQDVEAYSNLNNPQLMDRNLGALTNLLWRDCQTNEAHGLYYQWGRKDPFPYPDNSTRGSTTQIVTYDENGNALPKKAATSDFPTEFKWYNKNGAFSDETVAKYPMVFAKVSSGTYWNPTKNNLWGRAPYPAEENKLGNKTIYDPCPPGYRVMNPFAMSGISSVWGGGRFSNLVVDDVNQHNVINMNGLQVNREHGGLEIRYDETNTTYLPNTGTISNDGDVLQRCSDYGYYWTSSLASNYGHKAYIQNFDYNTLNLVFGSSDYSRACRGNVVRCEVIK